MNCTGKYEFIYCVGKKTGKTVFKEERSVVMNIDKLLVILLIATWTYSSCDVINPDEKIPTYIHIDSFRFLHQGDTFGSASHKISSVWVYFNNEPLGAFEMPVTVPVIASQEGMVTVAPGIDFNGMKSFQHPYPFYVFDSLILKPQPGQVVQFDARTRYTGSARLIYNSTFDLGNPFNKYGGDTSLVKTSDPGYVFEGEGAGYIYIDGPKKTSQNISIDAFRPTLGEPLFLELNYKCSIPFQVGVAAFYTNGNEAVDYVGGVNPRDEWNKIYISLQEFVNANQGAQFHLLIRTGTDNGESQGWVAIDNVKIVSF